MTLPLEQALATVQIQLELASVKPAVEVAPLENALGRVLAADAKADRDYPPFRRSARDGYAVRSADTGSIPTTLSCAGEARAGGFFQGELRARECVSIMTGAPVPEGADAVVMVEDTRQDGAAITILKAAKSLDNVVAQACEAAADQVVLRAGSRLGAAEIGLLASIGAAPVTVFRQPTVAILSTGDELVPVESRPEWFQIRNSNSYALAAQVALAGGRPKVLGIAPDQPEALRRIFADGLQSDLLLLSGGVSAGKYDFVESALADLGAEFYFDSVAIRPGKPVVFGRAQKTFFFGLPGNPVSAYVTFELFAKPAIGVLGGAAFEAPVFLEARISRPVSRREGLTAFVPARVSNVEGSAVVEPVRWQGSGDLASLPAANCFIVLRPDRDSPQAGQAVEIMPKNQQACSVAWTSSVEVRGPSVDPATNRGPQIR